MQDLPTAAIHALENIKRKFSNRREWREFLTAVQCTVNYPAAIHAPRSAKKWFSDGLAHASGLAPTPLRAAQAE